MVVCVYKVQSVFQSNNEWSDFWSWVKIRFSFISIGPQLNNWIMKPLIRAYSCSYNATVSLIIYLVYFNFSHYHMSKCVKEAQSDVFTSKCSEVADRIQVKISHYPRKHKITSIFFTLISNLKCCTIFAKRFFQTTIFFDCTKYLYP